MSILLIVPIPVPGASASSPGSPSEMRSLLHNKGSEAEKQKKEQRKVLWVECVLGEETAKPQDKPCCSLGKGRTAGPWHVPGASLRVQVRTVYREIHINSSLLYLEPKRGRIFPSAVSTAGSLWDSNG